MLTHLERVTSLVSAVAPIDGVGATVPGSTDIGPGNVRIDFTPSATQPQRDAANALVAGLDWSQAALDAWGEDQKPERKAIRQQAQTAIAANDTYLAMATPTNAQLRNQLDNLTRQNNAIIRRLIQIE